MMKDTPRERFLDRMRAAVRAWSQPAVHHAAATTPSLGEPTPTRPAAAPTTVSDGDQVALFCAMLTAAGGHAHRVVTTDAAVQTALDLAQARGVRQVVLTRHPELVRFPLAFVTAGVTVTVVGFAPGETPTPQQRAVQREIMARADLVISGADYAIAETGTIGMVAGPHNPRTATLLPPVHIAILDPVNLVPSMADLVARFKSEHLRDGRLDISSLTFITGPSRTGDIEQTLSVGVHGPGEVHVIVLG